MMMMTMMVMMVVVVISAYNQQLLPTLRYETALVFIIPYTNLRIRVEKTGQLEPNNHTGQTYTSTFVTNS